MQWLVGFSTSDLIRVVREATLLLKAHAQKRALNSELKPSSPPAISILALCITLLSHQERHRSDRSPRLAGGDLREPA